MSRPTRIAATLTATLGLALAPAAVAGAQGPPPPKAAGGQAVETIATGIGTPTSFAFDANNVFLGSAMGEDEAGTPGGIFLLKDGQATRIPDVPPMIFGLTARNGTVYASAGKQIIALTGFDGTKFTGQETIYEGGATFPGFNGLAIGPDGRLWAGVSLDPRFDGKSNPHRYAESVVSMKTDGSDLRVVAKGLRQPWQLAFVGAQRSPYVTELAKDAGKIPLDSIVIAKRKADYGYPKCLLGVKRTCRGFTKPMITLPKHSSPMGISAVGNTLYVALFGGIGESGPEVVTIPARRGGKPTPFLTGFVAPVVALGVDGSTVYAGDITGSVYRTTTG